MSTNVEVLGWTLVHFLWQGALIAACLQLFLVCGRKSSAQVRYLVRCLALAAMAALPAVTFFLLRGDTPLLGAAAPAWSGAAPVATFAQRSLPWIVALWSLGAACLSLRLCWGCLAVHRLQRHASQGGLPEPWQRSFERLSQSLGVRAVARVVDSAVLAAPAVIGWLKPVVLIPARVLTGLDEDQILALLAHELAHVRRHDYFVNLVQSVLEALLFYHPAVWWVSAGIRTEREYCCDDVAVELTHAGVAYARALTALETWRGAQYPVVVSTTGGSLMHRIQRLLGVDGVDHSRSGHGALQVLGALALATTAAASAHGFAGTDPSFAQDAETAGHIRRVQVDLQDVDEFKARRANRGNRAQDVAKVAEHLRRALEGLHSEQGVDADKIAAVVKKILAESGLPGGGIHESHQDARGVHEHWQRALQQLHEYGLDVDQMRGKIHRAFGQQRTAQDHYKRALEQLHEHGIDVDQMRGKIHQALGQWGFAQDQFKRALEQLHEHGIDVDQMRGKIHQALGQQGVARDHYKRALERLHEHGFDVEQMRGKIHEALGRQGVSTEVLQRVLEQQGAARELLKRAQNQLHEGGFDIQDLYKKMKGLHESDVDVQSILEAVHESLEHLEIPNLEADAMRSILEQVHRMRRGGRADGGASQRGIAELKSQIEKLRGQEAELREKKKALEWNQIRWRATDEEADTEALKQMVLKNRKKLEGAKLDHWRRGIRSLEVQPERSDDWKRRLLEALEEAGLDDKVKAKVMKALAGRGESV